jgi:hypothetical protein
MQSVPSFPADPGLRIMVTLACVGLFALLTGTIGAIVGHDKDAGVRIGGPLFVLLIVVSLGRKMASIHLPLMSFIVIWIAWNASKLTGRYRVCAAAGALGLAGALISGVVLF